MRRPDLAALVTRYLRATHLSGVAVKPDRDPARVTLTHGTRRAVLTCHPDGHAVTCTTTSGVCGVVFGGIPSRLDALRKAIAYLDPDEVPRRA